MRAKFSSLEIIIKQQDQSMPDGFVFKAPFEYSISNEGYNGTRILKQIPLLVCDEDDAPEYNNSTSMSLRGER